MRARGSSSVGLFLAALAFNGCSAENVFTLPSCDEETPCSAGYACIDRVCILEQAPRMLTTLDVEIRPAESSAFGFMQLSGTAVASGVLEIEVPNPAVYETVDVLDPYGDPVASRLLIFNDSGIPDRNAIASFTLTPVRNLKIVPGTYRVRVVPVDTSIPGIDIDHWQVGASGSILRQDFALGSQLREASGVVFSGLAGDAPLSGVEVRAFAIGSDLPSSVGLPSSVDVTDESGRFHIQLPETSERYFRLVAKMTNAPLAWTFEKIISVEPNTTRTDIEVGLSPVPSSQRGQAIIQLVHRTSNAPARVSNAHVTLTTTSVDTTHVFKIELDSDENGILKDSKSGQTPQLIAASYDVAIDPPPNSPFERTTTTIDLLDLNDVSSRTITIEVGARAQVQGRISSALGAPMSHAKVEFIPTRRELRPTTTLSNADAVFSVRLDAGDYMIRIEPGRQSDGTPAPIAHFLRSIPEDQAEVDLGTLSLPDTAVLSGTVFGQNGGPPLSGAKIEFFMRSGGRSYSIGSAQTDSSGAFALEISDHETR